MTAWENIREHCKRALKWSPQFSIAAHAVLAASCVLCIAIMPLTWSTILQAVALGWCAGAILALLVIKRSIQQSKLLQNILTDFRTCSEQLLDSRIENSAMRMFFEENNIDFVINRDGYNVTATVTQKRDDDRNDDQPDQPDPPEGKGRALH